MLETCVEAMIKGDFMQHNLIQNSILCSMRTKIFRILAHTQREF